MGKFDVTTYGTEELSNKEAKQIDGGIFQFIVAALVAGAIYDVCFHWGDTAASYKKGADAANAKW